MKERSRTERFDEVFQVVLIIVALSFDILWFFDRVPVAEIAVFVFVLVIWAYGNLRGGEWEYSLKLGSFNLSIILLTNFYLVAIFQGTEFLDFWQLALTALILPIACLAVTLILASYLGKSINRQIAYYVLIGGTLGYALGNTIVLLLAPF